jgi:hypothetical protein
LGTSRGQTRRDRGIERGAKGEKRTWEHIPGTGVEDEKGGRKEEEMEM